MKRQRGRGRNLDKCCSNSEREGRGRGREIEGSEVVKWSRARVKDVQSAAENRASTPNTLHQK
eukprot:1600303-Pleurochrysis_carterae.AAC.1